MYFYYGLLLFIVLLYLFLHKSNSKNHEVLFLKIVFLVLITVGSIRSTEVGGDLSHYLNAYNRFGSAKWSDLFATRTKYGYLFAIVCKFAYSIDPSPQTFLTVTSVASLLPIYYFIKKYSINPLMSVYVYITFGLYTNTFNSVRASLALGIGVLLFDYVIERKLWKFLLFYAVAVEIHQTFLPLILIYPLYKKEITVRYIASSIAVCFLLSQTLSILSYIYKLAKSYDEGSYQNLELITGGYSLLSLMIAITTAFFCINRKKMESCTKLWMHCMIVSCCTLCFATNLTMLTRVAMFFYVVLIVLFPETLNRIRNPYYSFLARCSVFVLFFVYFSIFLMQPLKEYGGSNNQRTIPYKVFFEENEQ